MKGSALVGKKTAVFAALAGITAAIILGGCGKSSASSPTAATAERAVKPKQIVVGTGNAMKDFCFLDEKGNLVGYELDVLSAVDELLPQYEFTFETSDFAGILVGLESGKYDIAAHYYARNPQRAEKYLYGLTPYCSYAYQIAVKAGRKDIQSVADLEGKSVLTNTGSNTSFLLESYNQNTAKTPINLVYGSLDEATWIRSLEEGRLDANISSVKGIADIRKAYDNRIDGVGPQLLAGYTYYIFRKTDTSLRDDVDGAIDTLRENGKLRELNQKWFNTDYSALIPELEEERAQNKYQESL